MPRSRAVESGNNELPLFTITTFDIRSPERSSGTLSRRENNHRSKRTQVSRACEWCRLNRVRCDNHARCHNCRQRSQECRREDRGKTLTLPVALREVERLNARIEELESQVETLSARTSHNELAPIAAPTPYSWQLEGVFEAQKIPQLIHAAEQSLWDSPGPNDLALDTRSLVVRPTSEAHCSYYDGSPSVHNLIRRLRLHLHLSYGWNYREQDLHPKAITLSLTQTSEAGESRHGVFMGRDQELECLRIFWQSYLSCLPVFDEQKLLEHHAALWSNPFRTDGYRDDSPLMDIVLAICIQYGMGHLQDNGSPSDDDRDEVLDSIDPSNAGRWYFKRSQALLKEELEKPSIMLLQCQILSVVYLRDASLFNTALSMNAAAIQTAYSMGLHLEENQFQDRHERELSKRLWCIAFALEGKMSMDAGRPSLVASLGIRLPSDDHELASSSVELFVPHSKLKITWLTFHTQHVKLIQVAREVFSVVSPHFAPLLGVNGREDRFADEESARICNAVLTQELNKLKTWLAEVPTELRYDADSQEGTEEPISWAVDTHQTPLWLRRQRAILILIYHDIIINLCRPLILIPTLNGGRPASSSVNAMECLNHAFAVTNIVHQTIVRSDTMHGWHRAYQHQWTAAIHMIAFGFSNLASPFMDTIFLELEKAIFILESFGRCFAVARSARKIVSELYGKLQLASARCSDE